MKTKGYYNMGRATFSKHITSDKLTAQINPENIKLMKRFLKDKLTRASEKTIKVYESNLTIFFTWNLLENNNKFFIDIKKIEFSDFFSYVSSELKVGSARMNNFRSVLSSLSIFIERFFDVEYPGFRNVILKVIESSSKELRREKTILTDSQIENLLQHLSEKNKQQAAWLALAICSGARFSELLRMDVDLIDENNTAFGDIFLQTKKPIRTKGRNKGKMLYKYVLRDKFLPYHKAWMIERDEIMKSKNQTHNSMFIQRDGTPATEGVIRGWIESFEEFLGVPTYPHAFRHYLTTLLSKKKIPAELIQSIFGWESDSMVRLYDDQESRDKEWVELENLRT